MLVFRKDVEASTCNRISAHDIFDGAFSGLPTHGVCRRRGGSHADGVSGTRLCLGFGLWVNKRCHGRRIGAAGCVLELSQHPRPRSVHQPSWLDSPMPLRLMSSCPFAWLLKRFRSTYLRSTSGAPRRPFNTCHLSRCVKACECRSCGGIVAAVSQWMAWALVLASDLVF